MDSLCSTPRVLATNATYVNGAVGLTFKVPLLREKQTGREFCVLCDEDGPFKVSPVKSVQKAARKSVESPVPVKKPVASAAMTVKLESSQSGQVQDRRIAVYQQTIDALLGQIERVNRLIMDSPVNDALEHAETAEELMRHVESIRNHLQ